MKPGEPDPCTPGCAPSVLFLDREGRWFHEGVEITHSRTRDLFLRNLARGEDQRYYVRVGKERAEVEVEDTPFLIASVTISGETAAGCCQYRIRLNDGSEEALDPRTLSIGHGNALYARVKGSGERARFLRPAYYQICARVEYDERQERFVLPWRGDRIAIQHGETPAGPGDGYAPQR